MTAGHRIVLGLLGTVWVASIAFGARALFLHESTAGAPARAPTDWPAGTSIRRTPGRAALLVFAHPECPCTSATLKNLSSLLTERGDNCDCWVVFDLPESGWAAFDSSYRELAGSIAGVRLIDDAGGRETRRFGAQTSGQVLFYGPSGRKLFSGGITSSRAHEGESQGAEILARLMRGQRGPLFRTPVYGCALIDSAAAETK